MSNFKKGGYMNTLLKNEIANGRFIPKTYSDILDGFFDAALSENRKANYLPSADITEDEKAFVIQVSVPGMAKEEIAIELNEKLLTITGERKFKKEENKKYHSVETYYGSFKRSFKLPNNVKEEAIEAEYTNGLLTITVPKEESKIVKSSIQIK